MCVCVAFSVWDDLPWSFQYIPCTILASTGIIAVEFAKIFRNLGADVTIVIRDMSPRKALMKIGLDEE